MKIDPYTKVVLTVIAIMLSVIAAKPFTQASSVLARASSTPAPQTVVNPLHFAVGSDGKFYFYADHDQAIAVHGPHGEKLPEVVLKF